MVTFTNSRLQTLFENLAGKRVAVIGDLMLDRYFWGSVTRMSPEAPVPVVEVESESTRLGGAANVANNIASLGGIPFMVGVVGGDDSGKALTSIVAESGFRTEGILVDLARPTTVKTRVIAHHQHVVRVDREVKNDIDESVQSRLIDVLRRNAGSLDAIIIEDYNKGVVVKNFIREVIDFAVQNRIIITVDPKFHNFFEFKHVTVFKPNRKETEEALGVRLNDQASVEQAGRTLVERLNAQNVLLTLGERGMTLVEGDGRMTHVPTAARKVSDVSGAGDTVISTLTMVLAAGGSIREASMLANIAGGIVCGEVGIVPIDPSVLRTSVTSS
ncbi:MAG: D-glycero-beta-D-manno-heptose-7-phosphate kinase [Ignavibacteriales bacterium]|nr:D-glycero-beta-D-manno-heptose-7-phosphate kinase [Ignavibacteriales bacterium]